VHCFNTDPRTDEATLPGLLHAQGDVVLVGKLLERGRMELRAEGLVGLVLGRGDDRLVAAVRAVLERQLVVDALARLDQQVLYTV
jgi:hypothetical protein